jgi:hypothetical protein
MGFGFRKSFKVAPGVRLNVGRRATGLSIGPRGVKGSVNTRGRRGVSMWWRASSGGRASSEVQPDSQGLLNLRLVADGAKSSQAVEAMTGTTLIASVSVSACSLLVAVVAVAWRR